MSTPLGGLEMMRAAAQVRDEAKASKLAPPKLLGDHDPDQHG